MERLSSSGGSILEGRSIQLAAAAALLSCMLLPLLLNLSPATRSRPSYTLALEARPGMPYILYAIQR